MQDRIPYSDSLAEKTDKAASEIAAGRPQGGRAADFGNGEGGLLEAAREYITPNVVMGTSGGNPSTGGLVAAPRARVMRYRLLRCFRRECRPRTRNRPEDGAPASFTMNCYRAHPPQRQFAFPVCSG